MLSTTISICYCINNNFCHGINIHTEVRRIKTMKEEMKLAVSPTNRRWVQNQRTLKRCIYLWPVKDSYILLKKKLTPGR